MEAIWQIVNFDLSWAVDVCYHTPLRCLAETAKRSSVGHVTVRGNSPTQDCIVLLRPFLHVNVLLHPTISTKGPSVSPAVYVNLEYMCDHCFYL